VVSLQLRSNRSAWSGKITGIDGEVVTVRKRDGAVVQSAIGFVYLIGSVSNVRYFFDLLQGGRLKPTQELLLVRRLGATIAGCRHC
jgi:hypothetical protein